MHTIWGNHQLNSIDYAVSPVDIFVWDVYVDFKLIWKKAKQYPQTTFNIGYHGGPISGRENAYIGQVPKNVNLLWDPEKCFIYDFYDKLNTNTFHKDIEHTVSSFNGSLHPTRTLLCLDLLKNNLWNKYCTKAFTDTPHIYGSLLPSNYLKDIVKILGQKKIKTFLGTIDSIEYDQETRAQHDKNFTLLKPFMDKTLINIFTSPPNGTKIDLPCADEKLILPISAKSMWIGYACAGYHRFIEQFYGFKLFENTFDYSFDSEPDFFIRLQKIMSQILEIHKLSRTDKMKIHNNNLDIIEYNYDHLKSGAWVSHSKQAWQKYNLTNNSQHHIIEK